MSRGATAELSGEAVTPHESFNGITLAAVVTETVRGWRGGRGMLGGGAPAIVQVMGAWTLQVVKEGREVVCCIVKTKPAELADG